MNSILLFQKHCHIVLLMHHTSVFTQCILAKIHRLRVWICLANCPQKNSLPFISAQNVALFLWMQANVLQNVTTSAHLVYFETACWGLLGFTCSLKNVEEMWNAIQSSWARNTILSWPHASRQFLETVILVTQNSDSLKIKILKQCSSIYYLSRFSLWWAWACWSQSQLSSGRQHIYYLFFLLIFV